MRLIDLDKPIADLNNLSLREVFEGGNLVVNGDFSDGTTWQGLGTNANIVNGELVADTSQSMAVFQIFDNTEPISKFYFNVNVKQQSDYFNIRFRSVNEALNQNETFLDVNNTNNQIFNSSVVQFARDVKRFQIVRLNVGSTVIIDNINLINLTALGIDLTVEQMDEYFAMYQSGVEASGFVQKTSKNLFDGRAYVNNAPENSYTWNGSDLTVLNTSYFDGLSPTYNLLPNTSYTLSIESKDVTFFRLIVFDENLTVVYTRNQNVLEHTFTTTSGTIYYLKIFAGNATPFINGTIKNVQLELGTVATTYQPYRPFALAKGIDEVAYGGKTYREIFEGEYTNDNWDFSDGLTGFNTTVIDGTITHTINNTVLITDSRNNDYNSLLDTSIVELPTNDVLYRSFSLRNVTNAEQYDWISLGRDTSKFGNIFLNIYSTYPDFITSTNFFTYSHIDTSNIFRNVIKRQDTTNTNPVTIEVSHSLIINLTQLFGAGNEPDKATMDKLFQQYQEGGTVQAQAFIQTAGKDTRVIDAKLPYLNMMSIREVWDAGIEDTLGLTQAELDAMFALYQAGTLKLSDVFETGNLVTNGDFSPNNVTTSFYGSQDISILDNNLYYVKSYGNQISGYLERFSVQLRNPNGSVNNLVINDSIIITNNNSDLLRFYYYDLIDFTGQLSYIATNLNTHNLQDTTKTFMDDLFKAYKRYSSPLFIDKDGVAYGQVFISRGD